MSRRHYLVVDDHPLMRDALALVLSNAAPDDQIDTCGCLTDALTMLETQDYDGIVLDLTLPDSNGVESIGVLRTRWPQVPILVVSGHDDRSTILRCFEAGAAGYVPKKLGPEVLVHALQLVGCGNTYLPAEILNSEPTSTRPLLPGLVRGPDARLNALSGRQLQVLEMVLRGLSNKVICRELNLAEGTVKAHVSAVLRALGVNSRAQAILVAVQTGLTQPHVRAESLANQRSSR